MYKIYKVSANDSFESIARKFNTTVSDLQDINGKEYIVVGELIIVPNNIKSDLFDTYIVEKGDTLYSIAKSNTSFCQIDPQGLNCIRNGQKASIKRSYTLRTIHHNI